ncbi:hypothetical protein GCM10009830_45010 [Glycomyces endophyticus]|uniref:Uncharacterized protein n=1 Tax=Glycomyces endophyticus TaxID=480996 RepID=A0ABP4TRS8_9ACTN
MPKARSNQAAVAGENRASDGWGPAARGALGDMGPMVPRGTDTGPGFARTAPPGARQEGVWIAAAGVKNAYGFT